MMIFGEVPVDEAESAILAHTVRAGSLTVKKGGKLSAAEVGALGTAGIKTVMVVRIEAGDVRWSQKIGQLLKVYSTG